MKSFFKIIFLFIALYSCFLKHSYSSSWTRNKGDFFTSIEFLAETNDIEIIFGNKKNSYYKNNYMQLYTEYGLLNDLTIGGYIKKYNFYAINYDMYGSEIQKISDDIYANLFLNQNLYKDVNNSISLQYSLYFPLKYAKISKKLNALDTSTSYEMKISFGNSKQLFKNLSYYFEISTSYKLINNARYDEITLNTTFGLSRYNSSSFIIQYEYNYFPESLLINNAKLYHYTLESNNKIKFINNYQFNDDYIIEFSYSKSFGNNNADAFSISIIFD